MKTKRNRNSDNAGGIRAKIERTRRQIEREIAHADAVARNEGVNFGHLLDPDFDTLDVIGSLAT